MRFGEAESQEVAESRDMAWELGLGPSQDSCRRAVYLTGM
jgi:hypothetical protein